MSMSIKGTTDRSRYKQEPEDRDRDRDNDEDEEQEPVLLGPAALGLQPVGTRPPPRPSPAPGLTYQKLNARGMPARIRKKNKLFFDDDIVNSPPPRNSPKRGPRTPGKSSTPSSPLLSSATSSQSQTPNSQSNSNSNSAPRKLKTPSRSPRIRLTDNEKPGTSKTEEAVVAPDPIIGRKIGMRLRNLLKLPKAHRWVCFEYFYSDIDRALFAGENDFLICLKESFPRLGGRKLTRVQWSKIRRMMGKPRRCSRAFFAEERKDLETKRKKIRMLQQRKGGSVFFKDLPAEIPLQLVVGTKVTARLRSPQDGLFTGTVEAFDTSNDMYRITFDRPGLGTHSVPDFEVLSNDPPDTLEVSSLAGRKTRNKYGVPDLMAHFQKDSQSRIDRCKDLLPGLDFDIDMNSNVGNYPAKLLERIIRITKILNSKRNRIKKLKEFNSEIERRKSFGERTLPDFERKYAAVVIELENMNTDLQLYLNEVQVYCHEIAPGLSVAAMLVPSYLREKCRQEASTLVTKNNNGMVKNAAILDLITDLTALLLQVKSVSDSEENGYELKVLQGTIEQIKLKLQPSDRKLFENSIEIHMQRIQMGLGLTGLTPCTNINS